jgi:hypothetical protein
VKKERISDLVFVSCGFGGLEYLGYEFVDDAVVNPAHGCFQLARRQKKTKDTLISPKVSPSRI